MLEPLLAFGAAYGVGTAFDTFIKDKSPEYYKGQENKIRHQFSKGDFNEKEASLRIQKAREEEVSMRNKRLLAKRLAMLATGAGVGAFAGHFQSEALSAVATTKFD